MSNKDRKKRNFNALILLGIGVVLLLVFYFGIPYFMTTSYVAEVKGEDSVSDTPKVAPIIATHIQTPIAVKGFYMTACVAGTPSWREKMKEIVKTTELNSIVIDIKDYSGTISFIDPRLQGDDITGCRVKDMSQFVTELHANNIYVIGRVTVFQDPYYAKLHPELAVKSKSTGGAWKDKHGLPFIDVGAKPYWDHVIDIAKASYALGFDEINFDYIRYPSDGNMADALFTWTTPGTTKATNLKSFFEYLHEHLKDTGMKNLKLKEADSSGSYAEDCRLFQRIMAEKKDTAPGGVPVQVTVALQGSPKGEAPPQAVAYAFTDTGHFLASAAADTRQLITTSLRIRFMTANAGVERRCSRPPRTNC